MMRYVNRAAIAAVLFLFQFPPTAFCAVAGSSASVAPPGSPRRGAPRDRLPSDVMVIVGETSGGAWSGGDPDVFVVSQPGATLSVAEVIARLNGGTSVQIVASEGSISIEAAIPWSTNTCLDLEAMSNVTVNADITASGSAAELILAPQMGNHGATYTLNNGARITLAGSETALIISGAHYTVINSVDSLQNVIGNLGGSYALGTDIDASETTMWNPSDSGVSYGFVPLGSGDAPFSGTLDGLGHVITGLYINWPIDYVGLVGDLASTASIKNVGLLSAQVTGHYYVGGIAGLNNGAISGTFNTGAVTGATDGNVNMAGGLIGYNSPSGVITQSYSTAAVIGAWGTGGFAGQNDGLISNSYSMGRVTGYNPGWSIGGFTGWYSEGSIADCYSTGYVTGGGATVGGFAGGTAGGTATDDYFDQSKSGAGVVCYGSCTGGVGLTTPQMMQQASFPGWDFAQTWGITEALTYPYLRQFTRSTPTSSQCGTRPSGLVGWWAAEDNGDDTVSNSNVVLSDSGASYSTGEVGQAFQFNGLVGYAENVEPGSAVNIGMQSWTISAWVQAPYSESNLQEIVSRYYCGWDSSCGTGSDGALYELVLSGSGQVQFNVRDNFSNAATAQGAGDLRDGKWHLIVGTLDRDAAQVRMYVDGVLQDSESAAGIGAIDDSSSPLEFGRLFRQGWASPDYYFKGLVDEVQIYNRALTGSEILTIYDAGSAGVCSVNAAMSVTPTELAFAALQGDSNPPSQPIFVSETSTLGFVWRATATQPWLSLDIVMGETSATINVSVDSSGLEPGTYTDTITINADGVTGSPAQVNVTFTVFALPAVSTTTLTSSPNPTSYGSAVTFTASVSGGAIVPTGSVMFLDGPTPLASPVTLDANGIARLSIATLLPGTHTITALYTGDSNYLPSASSASVQTVSSAACYNVPAGLVNWWPGENGANDSLGADNGSLVNGVTFATGIVGQAFSFNSEGQYVSLPNSPVQANPTWTVSAWFQTTSGGGIVGMQTGNYGLPLVSQGGGWDPLLYVGTDGKLHGGVWPAKFNSAQAVADGVWHLAAVSYDGNVVTEFLDDQTIGRISGITMSPFATTYIGTAYTVYWDYSFNGWFDFNGLIDEVTIFNRALTAAEIQGMYSGSSVGFCQEPVPAVTSISPASVMVGSSDVTLTVTGSNFTSSSFVLWNGNSRPTTFVNSGTLQAAISSTDLSETGSATVSVQNPPPGGGSSQGLTFAITSFEPPSPTATVVTDPQPTITINGNEVILHKELSGTPGYGANDGAADILYTGQAAAWHFSLPSSLSSSQIQGAFVRASLVADDHGSGISPYSLAGWVNDYFLGNGVADLPYGTPPASRFTDWTTEDYPAPAAANYLFTLQNTSNAGSGDWVGVDWLELHLIMTNPLSCAAPPSGMVSWWPADGNTNDIFSGLGGTLMNGVSYAPGEVGQAFSFTPPNQYVLIGDPVPSALQLQNQLTLQAWIYASAFPSDLGSGALGLIVGSQYDTNLAGATIFLDGRTNSDYMTNPPGHIHFQIGDGSWHECNTQTAVPLNQWVLITATRNANEDGKIYFNDVLQPTSCLPWSGSISYNGAWFAIGQQKDLNRPFKGLIDDVRVFNRSLSAGEVQGIYAAGIAGVCQVPAPVLTSVSPNSVVAGLRYLNLIVSGSNFTADSVVLWNGSPRATTYVDPTTLQADIAAADLASVGIATVSVQNPPPGGGFSGILQFIITSKASGTADMSLAAGLAPIPMSQHPMFEAVVANNGPDTATNAVVTDVIDRFGFISATYTTGSVEGPCSFDADSSTVTCYIGTMASGATGTVKVMVTAPSSGWASQDFYTTADQADPVPTNNAAHVTPVAEGYNTAIGENELVVTGDGLSISFSTVSKAGNTIASTSLLNGAPPAGFRAGNPAIIYNLSSSATYSGAVIVTLPFSTGSFHKPARARLFHLENNAWVDRTSGIDLNGRISAAVASLSTFAIFEPVNHAPTAVPGPNQIASATAAGGTMVHLDASGSSDPDADTLSYRWTGPFLEGNGTVFGATPAVTVPIGVSKLTLVVNDGETDSAPVVVSVTVTDFTIAAANSSATIKSGQSATVDLTLSPVYGKFDSAVNLSCPSLPQGLTCAFSAAAVSPGDNGATTRLIISRAKLAAVSGYPGRAWVLSYMAVAIFGFICMPLRRRRTRIWLAMVLMTVPLALLIACGGTGLQTQSSQQDSSTASLVNITVTGSSQSLQHSTVVTLTLD